MAGLAAPAGAAHTQQQAAEQLKVSLGGHLRPIGGWLDPSACCMSELNCYSCGGTGCTGRGCGDTAAEQSQGVRGRVGGVLFSQRRQLLCVCCSE